MNARPPLREVPGPSSALRILGTTIHTMTGCNVMYPPLPRPSTPDLVLVRPAWAVARATRPMKQVGLADAPLDGAFLPSAGPPPLAGPRDSIAASGPSAHGGVSGVCHLRAARPRSVAPRPAQPRGHSHGMLPLLGRHGGGQPVGGFGHCSGSPRASPSLGPPSMKPTVGGTATAPHSGDPPAYTGAREWSLTRWPRYWRPSGTCALSQFAAAAPPSLRPGHGRRTTERSWLRGGSAKPRGACHLSHALTLVCGPPAVGRVESPPPPEAAWIPSPPPPRKARWRGTESPLPLPARGTAVWPAPSPHPPQPA